MNLSIITVSWNVKEKLRENLNALLGRTADGQGPEADCDIYVVDNNSEDGTAEMVKEEFPEVFLVDNNANLGFAKANNLVLRQVETKYALLLNPDMRVKKGALKDMLAWMEKNPQATVAGCHLVSETGETIKQVRRFPTVWDQLAIVLKLPHFFPNILKKYIRDDFDYTKEAKVDSIRGGFFMINLEAIGDLKMSLDRTLPQLDERYFIWFEEVDYCRQVYLAGGEVWYTPVAECLDYVGQSFKLVPRGQAQKYFQDSMLKYFKRWHGGLEYLILKVAWPVGKGLVFLGGKAGFKKKHNT